MAGYSQFIWEDFADEIYALLRKCMSADASNSEAFLLENFNNEEIQNQIITYLKVCSEQSVLGLGTNPCRHLHLPG